jgi:exonuclease VII small subunit
VNGTLYAILGVVVFMIVATLFGLLVGRSARRRAVVSDADLEHRLATAMDTIRQLEDERLVLEAALGAAEKGAAQAREAAAEAARSAEVRFDTAAAQGDDGEELTALRAELERANENALRLEAELERRNRRISQLESARAEKGDAPHPEARPVGGFSTSAGSFADTRIVFSGEEPES